jgi:DNA-binding NtrC family response regulator
MDSSLEITAKRNVPVLSISPIADDHFALQEILRHLPRTLGLSRAFTLHSCSTLAAALRVLTGRPFEVVVCERDLEPGSWTDVLEQAVILPDPPSLIVTSQLADERLWAEVLNLGAYDVLAKPFDRAEAMRVVGGAWRAWGGPKRLQVPREHHKVKAATAGHAS